MNQNRVVVPLYRSTLYRSAPNRSAPYPSTRSREEIGSYRPCFEIGAGGMARVMLARETCEDGLQRTVALKILHEHVARDAELRRRFLDEARRLAGVNHPSVCRVLDFGEDEGTAFVAMEYLVGEKLSGLFSALERRSTELTAFQRARLFCRVIAELADGLHAAHEARDPDGRALEIVHYDVVPDNLFLLYDGTVRVADFGMARYRNKQLYAATTGRLLNKLWYMAPEQALSEPVDRRIDVWGLGVALWELVTLRRLFRRNTQLETMRAICSEPVPRLSTHVCGVPRTLDAIIARALEKNPVLRYQTARELAQALQSWLLAHGGLVMRVHLSEFLNGFFPQSGHDGASLPSRMQSGFESASRPERESASAESARPKSARPTLRPPSRALSNPLPRSNRPVSERPRDGESRDLEARPRRTQRGAAWASLGHAVWRTAVPVTPILFTLALLLAAQLDLSHRARAASGGIEAVSWQLARLQLQLESEAQSSSGITALTLRLPQSPATPNPERRDGRLNESPPVEIAGARVRGGPAESPR